MEADYGVISDPGVTMFVVTDGVADITPASSSVTLASIITYAGTQVRVEGCHRRERLWSQVGRKPPLWVSMHSVFLMKSKFLQMPGVMIGTANLFHRIAASLLPRCPHPRILIVLGRDGSGRAISQDVPEEAGPSTARSDYLPG